ncbi:helix-turn-helix transcriptional regulator [Nocardiopsis alba]|uniref:helix-turn-helix transcriptional regulator n=1 Tax=Nocardiopsis alba TaxID=53437 RepID=UPI00366E9331
MSIKTPTIPVQRSRGWLTVDEFCEDIGIARSTFNDWRAKGRGPKCAKLPSGKLRIRRSEAEKYMAALEDAS